MSWMGASERLQTLADCISCWQSGCLWLSGFWAVISSAAAALTTVLARVSHNPHFCHYPPPIPLSPCKSQRTPKEGISYHPLHCPPPVWLVFPAAADQSLRPSWPMETYVVSSHRTEILRFGRQTLKLVFSSDSENLKSDFVVKPVIFLFPFQWVGFLNYT